MRLGRFVADDLFDPTSDDMGLGKTIQMLAVMARDQSLHPKRKKQRTLIVA